MPVIYCGENMMQAVITKCHQTQELGTVDLYTIPYSIYLTNTPVRISSAIR